VVVKGNEKGLMMPTVLMSLLLGLIFTLPFGYNRTMRKGFYLFMIPILLLSCAPVIRKDLIDISTLNPSLSELKERPELYRERLFVLGGVIVQTKGTKEGALIEAVYASVDSRGSINSVSASEGRFYALYPREMGFLDPMVFRRGRYITIAGEFLGIREGKIDEMGYIFPLFEIKDIHLWAEYEPYRYPYYYPSYPFYPYSLYPYPHWWYRPWRYGPYWWW
jgi:outer membrane lipoprotein